MRRKSLQYLPLLVTTALLVSACGGNGNGGGNPTPPPSQPNTLYVRASGNDANTGASPSQALRTILRAVELATDNDMIIVGPGSYTGRVDVEVTGTAPGRGLKLIADPTGIMTNDQDDAGPVEVRPGEGEDSGFRLSEAAYAVIDGFRIVDARQGGNAVGVQLRSSSDGVIIRNCEISNNRDGVRIQDSADVLIFNNLIADNTNRGIRIGASGASGENPGPGSPRTQVISNTIANNNNVGIVIGDDDVASPGTHLYNNIFQSNMPRNIVVAGNAPSSLDGYEADYNLVFIEAERPGDSCSAETPPAQCGYGPFAPRGTNDVNANALFFRSDRGEYDLEDGSPAINAGTSDPAMVGADLVDMLETRSATGVEADNDGELDLGYHLLFE